MFKQNRLCSSLMLAFGSLALAPLGALAQQTVTTLQKVEVTGSNIKRVDMETSTPVQVISREEIARLGVNSVKELLDTLTAATGSLSDINGSNSFAGGASSASLRNLGKESTLILLNSRRVAPYALADYNEVFTNLDSLPFEAVERIEILRNGGSSIYGSDAVAGVINIITRRDYQGFQVNASRDQSTKNAKFQSGNASLTGGFGDLDKDRYNILANLEIFKRNGVVWRDAVDDINPDYGKKFAPVKEGSGLMFGNRGLPSTYSYPGNVIGAGPVPGCTTLNAAGLCVFDRFSRFQIQPAADRVNLLVSGKLNISDKLEGFSEILYSKTKVKYTSAFPVYGSQIDSVVWGDPSTGLAKTFVYRGLPANHPLNVNGEDEAQFRYRFADAISESTNESTQYRVLAGLKGTWDKYEWESAVGVMGGTADESNRGNLSDSGFKQVIGNYDPSQTDPLFFNRDYKIGKQNSDAVLAKLFPTNGTTAKTTQIFWDAKMSGDVTTFNSRPVGMAVGVDLRQESFLIQPTANRLAGDIVGLGTTSADASRTHGAVFTEFNIPLSKSVEVVAAGRIDKFPGFDAHLSPKLGASYRANSMLMLRGTMEQGFRAPNLTESAPSSKFAFNNGISDPKRCSQASALGSDLRSASDALPDNDPNKPLLSARADQVQSAECAAGVASVVRNNPNLKPEITNSFSLGFVLEPAKNVSMTFDYFNIVRRDEIGLKSTDDLLAEEDAQAPGVINRRSLADDKTFTPAEQAKYGVAVGPLSSTSGQFLNVSKTKTSGVDIGAAARFNTGVGKLDLSANATYLLELRYFSATLNGGLGDYGDNLAGRYGYSKINANLGATLATGAFTNGLRLNYNSATELQGDYFDTPYNAAGCTAKKWSEDECRVAAYSRVDYSLSYTGIKNLTLSAYVRNLFNKRSPVDLKAFERDGGGVIPQDREDVLGRSLRLSAEYKF